MGDLCSDSECMLGRWIQDEAENHAGSAIFAGLQVEHREFHRLASALAHRASEHLSATERMLAEGCLQEHSNRVLEALRLLKLRRRSQTMVPVIERPRLPVIPEPGIRSAHPSQRQE